MLGFNSGYIEELYTQYLTDPNSVSQSWQDFFADYRPTESYLAAANARATRAAAQVPVSAAATESPSVPAEAGNGSTGTVTPPKAKPASVRNPDDEWIPLRGPAAKIAENMEASISVPVATSVRSIPVKLLAENRSLINQYQRYVGGSKVSFTHLIAFALVRALREFPGMNVAYAEEDGTPYLVKHQFVNLGLAIDIERRGRRSLMVPNIKSAEQLTFPQFLGLYGDLIVRARNGDLTMDDFAATTASLTNPGMIGTSLSVPRLMQGQGLIVGVGAITYPPDYHAFAPDVISRAGISQVMTITSTYDHRVIQGAESGGFLARVGELLLGEHKFYESVFDDLGIQHQPYVLTLDNTPPIGIEAEDGQINMIRKQARVLQLIRAYRVRGHLQADINPLGNAWEYHPELDPATYGLTIWDLDRKFDCGGLGGKGMMALRSILDVVRGTYSRKVGIEYMHISDPVEKQWLQDRMEDEFGSYPLSKEEKHRVLAKLNGAEAFERFLHTKYVGHKRFSLEGAETVIPMLDVVLTEAAEQGVSEIVMGMAHRGRLNVLANLLSKPYHVLFSEFEGSIDPNTIQGSGDVKYHLGARGVHHSPSDKSVEVTLASNPSHLEAVNPVVEGIVRAKQYLRERNMSTAPEGDYSDSVLPLLIHGDAAFAGQGVVAETLNLSQLPGYHTGGTIHIVINNQIGFTTTPKDARSSTYATDVARMIQAPIFHVNGNDPEECVRIARMAFDYRQVFNKDVVIDMLCYRVHGHNEGDEPTYTQPLLYKKIEEMRSVRLLYTEALLSRGDLKPEEAEQMLEDYRGLLQEAFTATKELAEKNPENVLERLRQRRQVKVDHVTDTAVGEDVLSAITKAIHTVPSWFNAHPKLLRQFDRRLTTHNKDGKIDWGFGESLAFGSLLLEGTTVRLAGQDSQRGTFSHRHAVLADQVTGEDYVPLNHIVDEQAVMQIYDSFLSEYAACGFEYGYSVGDPSALVVWEAQFGDFANGAQIIFDQFLSAAEAKWGQQSGLVLMLPHGYEGQGPEHSSARLERFLQLCAEDNMLVCNLTTPANLFHALRSQVRRSIRKPMVIMSPKSLLRHPRAISAPADFTSGFFNRVFPASTTVPDHEVTRVLFASGKVTFDLMQAAEDSGSKVAIARVEQLYPFPSEEVNRELDRFSAASSVVWVQEEPENMGAWRNVRGWFDEILSTRSSDPCAKIDYVGRLASASTSTGSAKVHQVEQEEIISRALNG